MAALLSVGGGPQLVEITQTTFNQEVSQIMEEIAPPTGHLALVFTDVSDSTRLWEENLGMSTAMQIHNHLLRRQLRIWGGYEVKMEGDAFMCSFPTAISAVWFSLAVQSQLLHCPWPLEILESEDGKERWDDQGTLIAGGLSVRMGIHCGSPVCEPDPATGRMDYFGSMVNRSARISGYARGGQIVCSADVVREVNASVQESGPETEYSRVQSPQAVDAVKSTGFVIIPLGEVRLQGLEAPETLALVCSKNLGGDRALRGHPIRRG